MKKTIKNYSTEYEKPIMTAVDVCIEQGFGSSSQLEDMTENEGTWY